jgi:hypothetical protein
MGDDESVIIVLVVLWHGVWLPALVSHRVALAGVSLPAVRTADFDDSTSTTSLPVFQCGPTKGPHSGVAAATPQRLPLVPLEIDALRLRFDGIAFAVAPATVLLLVGVVIIGPGITSVAVVSHALLLSCEPHRLPAALERDALECGVGIVE